MALNNKLSQSSHKSKDTRFEQADQNEFEDLIQQWVGEQTGTEVKNLSSDFADGSMLLQLMSKIAKDNLVTIDNFDLESELAKTPEEKIEKALQIAELMGTERFLRVQDIASGNPKLIFTLLAETFSNAISNEVGVGKDTAAER